MTNSDNFSRYLNPNVRSDRILTEKQTPNLTKSMGVKYDKVRHAQQPLGYDKPFGKNVVNNLTDKMWDKSPSDTFCSVNDAIVGVALSGSVGSSKPLNVTRLYNILQCLENVNTRTVGVMCGLSERQARKYVQAVRIVIPVLVKTFENDQEDVFLVSDDMINDLEDY